jgi:nitrite reductase/ring-hydroxylating ferredoxin subunit
MFKRKSQPDEDGYLRCPVAAEAIGEGQMTKVKVGGLDIVLARVNGQIYAFRDTCPHGAASLAEGSLSGSKISCPDHGYCFDIRTGALLWLDDEPYRLRRIPVKLVEDEIRLLPSAKKQER